MTLTMIVRISTEHVDTVADHRSDRSVAVAVAAAGAEQSVTRKPRHSSSSSSPSANDSQWSDDRSATLAGDSNYCSSRQRDKSNGVAAVVAADDTMNEDDGDE